MQKNNIINKTLDVYFGVLMLLCLFISFNRFSFNDALYMGIVVFYYIKIRFIIKK